MARKTKEDALQTRQDILNSACKVFLTHGVASATLEQIAEHASVTRGAVYWHFKNKQDIFLALNDALHQPFIENILSDLKKDHPHPIDQLEALCIKIFKDLVHDQEKKDLLTLFFLRCDYIGDTNCTLIEECTCKKEHEELFQRYFKKAQNRGLMSKDEDPYILTISLIFYMHGILLDYLRNPDKLDLENIITPLMKQFFRSYK